MTKVLALYDIMGIQDYIFSSPRLKENVGASIIVQQVFEDFFGPGADGGIKEECPGATVLNWQETGGLKILEDDGIAAEVVYLGGGNAMVAYRDKTMFETVTRAFSKTLIEKTGGSLQAAAAVIDIGGRFDADREKLFERLKRCKFETPRTFPLAGIAITREGVTDGLPAAREIEEGRYISRAAHLKIESQATDRYFEERLLEEEKQKSYVFAGEFDHLGQREGESHMAVVHIDGNNMGRVLNRQLAGIEDYDTAVNRMKRFSRQVTDRYNGVMKQLVRRLTGAMKDQAFFDKFNIRFQESPQPLYFRPLVLSGDDVTFVVDGRLGVPAAEIFLNRISRETIRLDGEEIPMSACAGVAIVKSHFPFSRAYQLAEELCRFAKLKGKLTARLKGDGEKVGSWLDFHIVHSGLTTDLAALRAGHYNVPGKKPLPPLEVKEHGTVVLRMEQFHLLGRPWCTAGETEAHHRWHNLHSILMSFKDENRWPRSRLKRLRNVSIKSETDIRLLLAEFASRGQALPDFDGKRDYFVNHQSPYFDALELLDYYENIPEEEGTP